MCEDTFLHFNILRTLWAFCGASGVTINGILLYCVCLKTPKELRIYSIFLFYQSATELITSASLGLLMTRLEGGVYSDGILQYTIFGTMGLASLMGPRISFLLQTLAVGLITGSLILIPICVCYRLYVIYFKVPKQYVVIFICFLNSCPIILYLLKVLSGLSLGSMPGLLVSFIAAFFILRRIRLLKEKYSTTWVRVNRGIVTALAFQSCVPFLSVIYFAIERLWFMGIITGKISANYAYLIFGVFPVVNGFVNLYFIPYYRRVTFRKVFTRVSSSFRVNN